MESPIPILPLPTPDAETEKLIRMKDEEVCGAGGGRGWRRRAAGMHSHGAAHRPRLSPPGLLQLRRMQEMLQRMKQQMQDQ